MRAFRIEWKRYFNRTFLIILIILAILTIFLVQSGTVKYKARMENSDLFVDLEQKKMVLHPNNFQYFFNGFRLLVEPDPVSLLFYNSMYFGELNGYINNGISMKLSKPQIGSVIFDKTIGGVMDLSWFFLIAGSILTLAWGLSSFKNTELIKFMLNFTRLRSIYLGIILARVLLIILVLVLLGIIIWAQFLINGISLGSHDLVNLVAFILLTITVMIIFLLIGSFLGAIKNKTKMAIFLSLSWLVLMLVWPEIINSIFSQKATLELKQNYAHEEQNLRIILDLEKSISDLNKNGSLSTETTIDNVLRAYQKIEDLEMEMIGKTKEIAGRLHFWSIFNPVTFYKSVNNELSSMGYGGYTAFYEEVIQKQKAFVDFYIQKRFYEKSQKVEPFLMGDEYIFKAKGSFPRYFALGLALNLFYLLVALFLGFQGLKKAIYQKPEKLEHFKDIDLKLSSGGKHFVYIFLQQSENFAQQVYNALSGEVRHFTGKISIDGNVIAQGQRKNFIYLPNPNMIPDDIQTGDILTLSGLPKANLDKIKEKLGELLEKPFSDLEKCEKIDVLLMMVKPRKAEIYLIYDFLAVGDKKHIRKAIKEMKGQNNLVIELSSRPQYLDDDLYQVSTIFFEKSSGYSEDKRHK